MSYFDADRFASDRFISERWRGAVVPSGGDRVGRWTANRWVANRYADDRWGIIGSVAVTAKKAFVLVAEISRRIIDAIAGRRTIYAYSQPAITTPPQRENALIMPKRSNTIALTQADRLLYLQEKASQVNSQ